MKEYIKIAWRNIWRNRRRSIITISSIFFAVFLAIVMRSFQLGTYAGMINSFVEMFSGYIQIEHKDFPDEKSIENTIAYSEKIIAEIETVNNVKTVVPRLNYFAFASWKTQTKGVLFSGINPELENSMTKLKEQIATIKISDEAIKKLEKENLPKNILDNLKKIKNFYFSKDEILKFDLELTEEEIEKYFEKIKKYAAYKSNYLAQNDKGILIGSGLAKYLKIKVGDSLVLLGQGYHGTGAADKFPVRGVVKIPNPKLNSMMIYGVLKNVQNYYSAYEISENGKDTTFLLTNYAINLHKKSDKNIYKTRDEIIKIIDNENYIVNAWKEANKQLANQIKSDNESGKMIIGILYIVIAFGIFGTVLMMIAERKREMGVMIALGMKKIKLSLIITFEMLFISFVGLVAGISASSLIIIPGHLNPIRIRGDMAEMLANYGMEPILPLAWFDVYILNQAFVIVVIVLIVMIYPIISVSKLKVIDALRA